MALHSTAQGLATLGRHGDSVLVHMQPQEVAGLQALAKSQGTSLTVNPHTGMPEAFRLGEFFSSLLPTLVGAALAPSTGGASLGLTGMAATAAPIVGGMATGALVAGAKGEDVLGGALMGGIGGYGGGNLGGSLAKMGGAGAVTPAISTGQGVQLTANNLAAPNLSGLSGGQAASALDASANNLSSTLTNSLGSGPSMGINYANAGTAPGINIGSNALDLARAPSGFESLASGAGKFASDPFGQFDAFKEAGGSPMQIGAPLAMATLSGMQPEPYDYAADEAKRKEEENKYRGSTGGLNLSPSSGLNLGIPSFATGGTINTNRGTISGGGLQDLYGANDNTLASAPLSQDGYGLGRLNSLVSAGANAKAANEYYARGGPVSFADGGDTGMNVNAIPSLNVNTGRQGGGGGGGISDILYQINDKAAMSPILKMLFEKMPQSARGEFIGSGMGSFFGLQERPRQEYYTSSGERTSGYAQGGYLNGNGDGMSDSIPATIEGKQPARLADGEFVVPADVVSHIGNGSSKAGSKRLYAMLDKVRKARTGHTKQGKQINPSKYMPA
jgi:hypothetical protein